MGLNLKTPATTDPVSLSDMKEWMRVETGEDNGFITGLITAATEDAQNGLRRQLVTATFELTLDAFPKGRKTEILLPNAPLAAINSIKYNAASDGTETTWASSDYDVDTNTEPGRVVPAFSESYPSTRAEINAVTVDFDAGYGSASAVPETIKVYIKYLVSHMYEFREPVVSEGTVSSVPQTIKRLFWLNRTDILGEAAA